MIAGKGFTLIELLLSVAALSIILGISMPVYVAYQNRNELDIKIFEIASMYRRAQMYARTGTGDSQWGVNVQSGVAATLFKGNNFATRDTSEDEVTILPATITSSGVSTIIFAKLTGIPSASGTTTLNSSPINQSKNVTINSAGMVAY